VHKAATEKIAQGVGVVGQDDLGHLGLCAGDCAEFWICG
jgi:hypothetical protein